MLEDFAPELQAKVRQVLNRAVRRVLDEETNRDSTAEKMITARAVADRLNVSTANVKLGRYVRFRSSLIEEWIVGLEDGMAGSSAKRRGAAGTAPGMAAGGKS